MKAWRTLWKHDLQKLFSRPASDWLLLVEAGFWLGVMRAAILIFRFQKIAGWLGLSISPESPSPSQVQSQAAGQVGWAIRVMAPRTFWESACLAQSLTCAQMLNRRRIPGLLYLGVALGLTTDRPFAAHAWMRCGENILVGESGHERFQVLATFSTQN